MKRFLLVLLLIPSLAFGAFTEFYCQNGGSNVNAGSTNNNTPTYTKAHGNWTQSTGVFTVQDGTNPSGSVSVGQWAAVMVDGGTVAAYIGRITAVQNANNGTITFNTAGVGSKPANQTATATITVGGAWQGPNGASGFPFTLTSFGANVNASSDRVRVNLKNDQTYSVTAAFSATGTDWIAQGYTSSLNDGGKATIDGSTSTGNVIGSTGSGGTIWVDLIFVTSITSGTATLVTTNSTTSFYRVVAHGARGHGFSFGGGQQALIEVEVYDCNKSNTSALAGINMGAGSSFISNCIIHDNSGSNASGIVIGSTSTNVFINSTIFDTNGLYGIAFSSTGSNVALLQNDFYNNGSDAINIGSGSTCNLFVRNCNFIKNTGKAIDNLATVVKGFADNNGYGSGTQANGSSDALGGLVSSGAVTYASDVTPWVDPANGDFRINLAAAMNAGRGAYTETASSYAGTVAYPDIGAANHNDTCTGTGPCQTSGASSY